MENRKPRNPTFAPPAGSLQDRACSTFVVRAASPQVALAAANHIKKWAEIYAVERSSKGFAEPQPIIITHHCTNAEI